MRERFFRTQILRDLAKSCGEMLFTLLKMFLDAPASDSMQSASYLPVIGSSTYGARE